MLILQFLSNSKLITMVIGFEAKRIFTNYTGLGNYSRTLLNNAIKFGPDNFQPLLFSPRKVLNERTKFLLQNTRQILPKGPSLLWRSYRQQSDWRREGLNLYHGLSGELPFVNSSVKIPLIVTIHDVIFRQYPKMYKPLDRSIYHLKTKYALDRADCIIAISEATKNAVLDYYKVDSSKIVVLYQAADSIFENFQGNIVSDAAQKKYGLPSNYWLYVGAVNQRKQLLLLFQALLKTPVEERIPVVVVGEGGPYLEEVHKYINSHHLQSYFIPIPSVDFTLLPSIYSKATALIYPSLFEGFGIPLIEALWTGCPVITSNRSSMPEAAGKNAYLIDPTNVEELIETMRIVLQGGESVQHSKELGRLYVEKFKGEKVTQELFSLYSNFL